MLLLISILLPLLVFISDGVLAARRAEPSGTEAVAHHEAVFSKQTTYWDSTLPGVLSQDGHVSLEAQGLAAQSGFSAKQEEARLPTIDLRPRKAHRFFKHFFSAGAFLAFLFLVHSLKSQWNTEKELKELVKQLKKEKEELREQMKQAGEEIKEEVKQLKEDLKEEMKQAKEDLKEEMKQAKEDLKEEMKQALKEELEDNKEESEDLREPEDLEELIQQLREARGV